MTIAEAVDSVLAEVDFTAPVELPDVIAVHARIAQRMPLDVKLESYHRIRDVVFEVRKGHDVLVHREKKVLGA